MVYGLGDPSHTYTLSGILTSATTRRPFVFTHLELTDNDQYLNETTAGLGVIRLVISHATFSAPANNYTKRDAIGKVHEKSKKATGHKVDLGENKTISYTKTVSTTLHDVIITFIFKYRPLDLLRANGIASTRPA
ncbi:hypothetical protein J3R30DRAFT_3486645 [Lentinula aciculospora]|uniref:DUF7918 domain-containing protein n=1 Tax=Lentinula aciculospora TaxID=153920 RepID=A0A9W9DNI2_9AGAR|nr:hypothetical protein J3R30DRAFT_3486645 [Lentinula aciculospora]